MKKLFSFILSVAIAFGFCLGRFTPNDTSMLVSAEYSDEEEEELYEPIDLLCNICNDNGIFVTNVEDDVYTAKYETTENNIPSLPDGDETTKTIVSVAFRYDDSGCTFLSLSDEENAYTERLAFYPEFDSEEKTMNGNVLVRNENGEEEVINIFRLEEEDDEDDDYDENEEGEEGCDEYGIQPAFFLASVCTALAVKVIATVAVAVVAAVVVCTHPTYVSDAIETLVDVVEEIGHIIINGVKYAYTIFTEELMDKIATASFLEQTAYYVVIPIIDENVQYYQHKFPDFNLQPGSMLITSQAISYSMAKRSVRWGHSIYTFGQRDAYRVARFSFLTRYTKLEYAKEKGYYDHYHPCYKYLGKTEPYAGIVDGMTISIHCFFGYPYPFSKDNKK